jgi:thioredoxin 1
MQQFDSITYNEKINEDKLTIVKYKANWCGPCRVLSPILEGVVKNYTDINVGEVDIDTNMSLAQKDGIRGVPTVVFYKNGKLLDKMVGLQPAQSYIDKINSLSN